MLEGSVSGCDLTGVTKPNIHGATHRKAGPANVKERRRCETPLTCCILLACSVPRHELGKPSRINTMN